MDDSLLDPDAEKIPLEQALEAVARRLAGVTAAVDGFAERQQDMLGRDYGEDLGLIHQSCQGLRHAIDGLAHKPALALTPEMIARQIEAAGQGARRDANQALVAAQGSLHSSIAALSRVTESVRTAKRQNQTLAGAAGLAVMLGWLGGCTISPAIDWIVPEAWQWPEKRAESALRREGWEAGERLLMVTDPERWQAVQVSTRLLKENSGAIERCARRAAVRKLRSIGCTVEVQARDR